MPIKHPLPKAKEITQVISMGGNQCAFDVCDRPIVIWGQTKFKGEMTHINSRREGGPRFDPKQTPEENCSVNNLMAMCNEHGDIVDAQKNLRIYTAQRLREMKHDHEAKFERRADRGWIRHPNFITNQTVSIDGSIEKITLYFWIDRHGKSKTYTPRQKETTEILLKLYQNIDSLCKLQELTINNPDAPGRSLLQNYSTMKIDGINQNTNKPWTPIAHILRTMAQVPNITFGEFAKFLLSDDSNPTNFFIDIEKEFKSKSDPKL